MTKATETPAKPDNLRIWNALSTTDPKHTKPITGRGFDGTAIKPMFQLLRMTETFGPVGQGWGMNAPEFQLQHAQDGTILVYCTVKVWYRDPETNQVGEAYGVGGDVVAGKRRNGNAFHDDEAYKKCYTDALGNAFKFIGVAADIHMGMFDDSKYVQAVDQEFRRAEDPFAQRIDDMLERIRLCKDPTELVSAIFADYGALGKELSDAGRRGDGAVLVNAYKLKKAELIPETEPAK